MSHNQSFFSKCRDSVVAGDVSRARKLAKSAAQLNLDPVQVIEMGFVQGLNELGERWERGESFLPELVVGANAAREAISILRERLPSSSTSGSGKVVMGTTEGDIHDIGKTLVSAMLVASGFEVHDLGCDVKAERFVEEAARLEADLVGVSALLTTTMLSQRKVIDALDKSNLRGKILVMVGGAPTSKSWAEEIGADGYAENAVEAAKLAKKLLAKRQN